MATTTRRLTNRKPPETDPDGDPIVSQEGTPLPGFVVSFQLCDATGAAIDVVDAITNELVISGISTREMDANGLFDLNLWPNDRGSVTSYYRCTTSSTNDSDRLGQVPSGAGDYLWITFMQNSIPVP